MVVNAVAPWEGQLVWVGTPNGGYSQNGQEWKSVDFTLKYTDSRLQEKFITFNAFGVDRVNKLLSLPIGTLLQVTWAPDTRRTQGQDGTEKWWPCFAVFGIKQVIQQPVMQQQAAQIFPSHGTQTPPQAPAYQPQPVQQGYQQPVSPAFQQLAKPEPDDDIPF